MQKGYGMKIREFAKSVGFEVVGKLTYVGIVDYARMYLDSVGNEYYYDTITKTFCIVTYDGAVI